MSYITDAFEAVKREDFVPKELLKEAGIDAPLPIGAGQTISQPYTVRFMLELLDVKEGNSILDVGSGSGWTTALLAYLAGPTGKVIGVERVPELVKFGRGNLAKYKFPNARIEQAGKDLGWPKEGLYDRILVSAAAKELPEKLVAQLKVDGIMVCPISNTVEKIMKQRGEKLERERHEGFAFVPLVT